MRSFEVTNDGQSAFFSADGADGLYVVGTQPRKRGTLVTIGD
jgi:hypothetical protein